MTQIEPVKYQDVTNCLTLYWEGRFHLNFISLSRSIYDVEKNIQLTIIRLIIYAFFFFFFNECAALQHQWLFSKIKHYESNLKISFQFIQTQLVLSNILWSTDQAYGLMNLEEIKLEKK